MAEINSGKFDNVYKLLLDHDFVSNVNISDNLKCNKCRNILVNACQAPCGCLFCHNCINGMMATGNQFCPGNTEFCKDEQITNYQVDHRINKMILKLVVKCPEEFCPHECELINMEEHIRVCSNKCIKCPFYGLGCDNDKLVMDKMGGHLQTEGFNHNKILIGLIGELRNEVNLLKGSNETNKIVIQNNKNEIRTNIKEIQSNKDQIQILQANSRMKDQTIAEMQQQIRSIKTQNQQIAQQIEALKALLESQTQQIAVQMQGKCSNDQIQSIKTENQELARRMEILERNLNKKVMEKWAQRRQLEEQDDLDNEVRTRNYWEGKWQDKSTEAVLSWRVDQISDKRKKYIGILSEIFYPKASSYKMKLWMGNIGGIDRLCIQLCIYDGGNDAPLQWPFQWSVTIQISNEAHPNVLKTVTQYCNVPKPNNNLYKCSDPFYFSYAELFRVGLIQDDYLTINCYINFCL